jgi:hypothetical protein
LRPLPRLLELVDEFTQLPATRLRGEHPACRTVCASNCLYEPQHVTCLIQAVMGSVTAQRLAISFISR